MLRIRTVFCVNLEVIPHSRRILSRQAGDRLGEGHGRGGALDCDGASHSSRSGSVLCCLFRVRAGDGAAELERISARGRVGVVVLFAGSKHPINFRTVFPCRNSLGSNRSASAVLDGIDHVNTSVVAAVRPLRTSEQVRRRIAATSIDLFIYTLQRRRNNGAVLVRAVGLVALLIAFGVVQGRVIVRGQIAAELGFRGVLLDGDIDDELLAEVGASSVLGLFRHAVGRIVETRDGDGLLVRADRDCGTIRCLVAPSQRTIVVGRRGGIDLNLARIRVCGQIEVIAQGIAHDGGARQLSACTDIRRFLGDIRENALQRVSGADLNAVFGCAGNLSAVVIPTCRVRIVAGDPTDKILGVRRGRTIARFCFLYGIKRNTDCKNLRAILFEIACSVDCS